MDVERAVRMNSAGKLLIAFSLAVFALPIALVFASGDLLRCPVLIPTALMANFIVLGGPDGSGQPIAWIIVFVTLTLAVWTIGSYVIVSLVIEPVIARWRSSGSPGARRP
jgi:hypothetical protein